MVKRVRSIRLPEEIERAVIALAEKEERSFNNMVSVLLREALKERGEKIEPKK